MMPVMKITVNSISVFYFINSHILALGIRHNGIRNTLRKVIVKYDVVASGMQVPGYEVAPEILAHEINRVSFIRNPERKPVSCIDFLRGIQML